MPKNLRSKTLLIVAVLLVFVYGIFGIPHGSLKESITRRINLGLDLRGGTHLILQVMVDEAINAATDADAVHMQADLQSNGITATATKPDATKPTVIDIAGIPAASLSNARTVLANRYAAQYDIASSANGGLQVTMKNSAIAEMKANTITQAIDVIRTRVDSLGVSEPVIQEYNVGSSQILVELPGIDDPARVKDVIQSTARLEIHLVTGGPFTDEAAALASLGGSVPYDTELLHAAPGAAAAGSGDQIYAVTKAPEVAGTDIRDAQAGRTRTRTSRR